MEREEKWGRKDFFLLSSLDAAIRVLRRSFPELLSGGKSTNCCCGENAFQQGGKTISPLVGRPSFFSRISLSRSNSQLSCPNALSTKGRLEKKRGVGLS